MEANEMLEALSWYGAILKNDNNKPVLFPANRMGYMMDGAEISDNDGNYNELSSDKFSMVKCYFIKDGIPISPEQASEDYNYQGLGFQIQDICEIGVSNLGSKIDNLFEYYQEDTSGFKEMLEYVMTDFLETEIQDKQYLGFVIIVEDKGESYPCLYCMNKFGSFYPGFMYKAQNKLFENFDDKHTAQILQVQFQDGTVPVNISDAYKEMSVEPENIFITAKKIGEIQLQEQYDSWEQAIEESKDTTLNTLRMGMYALHNQMETESN